MVKREKVIEMRKKAKTDIRSFHIQLPADMLRQLRVMAAERGTSAGRLAREFMAWAMEEEARKE